MRADITILDILHRRYTKLLLLFDGLFLLILLWYNNMKYCSQRMCQIRIYSMSLMPVAPRAEDMFWMIEFSIASNKNLGDSEQDVAPSIIL